MPFTTTAAIMGTGMAGTVAADLALIGTGLTAASQYQAGKQQEAMHKYNAQVQANQAQQEEWAAQHEAEARADRGRKLMASQRTGFAKAGVSAVGTPLLVFEQTARDISEDMAMTTFGGTQRADYYRSQASLSRLYGRSARRAGAIGAGTSLLSGASQSMSTYRTTRA